MNIVIAYVFPSLLWTKYQPLADRFVLSYHKNPPGFAQHEVHVVVNGPPPEVRTRAMFANMDPIFHTHDNTGKDLGAFKLVADTVPCDLLICLGAHIHFPKPGWLDHLVESYLDHGPGYYGCWGFHEPSPHIRTTAFWAPPQFLSSYPVELNNSNRYRFEHGRNASMFWWARGQGFPVGQVSWRETRLFPHFDHVPENECLMFDQHTDRMGYK